MKYCTKVKLIRKYLNLNQTEFGEILGRKQDAMCRIESGKTELYVSDLERIFACSGITPNEFFSDNFNEIIERKMTEKLLMKIESDLQNAVKKMISSNRIRHVRKNILHMSQVEFAKLLEIPCWEVSHIETKGKEVSEELQQKILNLAGMTYDEFARCD